MLRLKLGFVGSSGSDACLRITVQPVTSVKCDLQRTLALHGCLLHKLWGRYVKAVVGHRQRVGMAETYRKPLLELFSDRIRQRRFRLVIDAQDLLSHGVRPARQKAALGRRRPALHTENPGNVDSLAVELNDQRVSGEVIAHRCDRQDVRAERRKVVGSVGAASRNNFSFAMLEDQDRRFTRDARNFAILEFIGNEVAKENDGFAGELLDALAEGEKVDGG